MSLTETIPCKIKNAVLFAKVARKLGLAVEENTMVTLYDGTVFSNCLSILLPGWQFPLVLKDDKLYFDTYNGRWGSLSELNKLRQEYQLTTLERVARRKGRRTTRETLRDGKVRLRIKTKP